jgi:hypothetical protein
MKKTIIIALLGIVSISAFAQSKTVNVNIKKADVVNIGTEGKATVDSSFAIPKKTAISLYGLLDACKEAVATTSSKKITVADANVILESISNFQKTIYEAYAPKEQAPSVAKKPKK